MHTINTLRPDNSVLCLIDHQPWVAFTVRSIAPTERTNNVLGLAKSARALNVPTVLSTINGESGPLRDPLFAGLAEVFPEHTPIDRNNTNAWSDPAFVQAVKDTGPFLHPITLQHGGGVQWAVEYIMANLPR